MARAEQRRHQHRNQPADDLEPHGKRRLAAGAAGPGRRHARRLGRSHLSHHRQRCRPGPALREHGREDPLGTQDRLGRPEGARRRRQLRLALAGDRRQACVGFLRQRRTGLLHASTAKKSGRRICKTVYGTFSIQFGMASTPVLDGDRLYLQLLNTSYALVVALDKVTGPTDLEADTGPATPRPNASIPTLRPCCIARASRSSC